MELPKMKLTSASASEINLEALYQICPSCFTEVKDEKTGELTHKINFNILRELLGDNAFEGADEEYGFNWVGKNAARREAARVITKTLRPCPEESVDWENTQNLYIEGDNLEVLKLLQKSYLGKIKMIYIDPPYNTGNDFVYRDDFAMDKDGYDRAAGDVDELGNRFRKNVDTNARFHSDWCSMIYERLLVSRALLSNDGVIFISIDDNEVANLKKICDEIFGDSNFISKFDWRKKTGANDAKDIAVVTESILLYAKNHSVTLSDNIWTRDEDSINTDRYKFEDEFVDTRGKFYYDTLDRGGLQYSDSMNFGIQAPDGGIIYPNGRDSFVNDGWIWKWSKEKVNWGIENKFLEFVKSNKSKGSAYTIKYKVYQYVDNEGNVREKAGRAFMNLITDPINQIGNSEMKVLFDNKAPFSNPKPVGLIRYLFKTLKHKEAIVLDFFSGSASSAHAVMQMNAEDGGKRKFIMVQLPEETEAGSEAYKAGYKNICEIGKERIRRAGKKIKEEGGLQAQNLDIGFRVFKCEDSFMNDVYFSPAELKQEDLFSQVKNIKDGTSDLSMLFGCMLDWGVQLSLPLSDFTVSGKKVYNVNDGDLVACFAEDVNEDVISAIAELSPLRVVFRDSCFKEAAFKMNLFELFKQKCGWSEEQVKSRVHVI
ncbi:MAG: site-specific DNA-methyltransferase [Bacteroidales bacterium]|nr:site-specific DNA-methyltransferase [Bacteroidales bacterium]